MSALMITWTQSAMPDLIRAEADALAAESGHLVWEVRENLYALADRLEEDLEAMEAAWRNRR